MFTRCIYKEEMMKASWPEYHLVLRHWSYGKLPTRRRQIPRKNDSEKRFLY